MDNEERKNQESTDNASQENNEQIEDQDLDQARGGLRRQPSTDQTLRR